MDKACIAFEMNDEFEALAHLNAERAHALKDYGSIFNGLCMYAGDGGLRMLCRCNTCGGLYLIQKSEEHFMSDSDEWYLDYFPVSSIEEGESICKEFDGDNIINSFRDRFLQTIYDHSPFWRFGSKLAKNEKDDIQSRYDCNFPMDW